MVVENRGGFSNSVLTRALYSVLGASLYSSALRCPPRYCMFRLSYLIFVCVGLSWDAGWPSWLFVSLYVIVLFATMHKNTNDSIVVNLELITNEGWPKWKGRWLLKWVILVSSPLDAANVFLHFDILKLNSDKEFLDSLV